MSINKNNVMSKKIFILFGVLFLILLLGGVSAVDMCWVEASSADCVTNNGKVVMSVSGATNAHGALAGQGTFIPVLCCNFGGGDTTCTSDNKIIGLSSSTNAHAEIPDLVSPNYNIDVCYDSLKNCRITTDSCSVAMNEIEVLYLSSDLSQSYTNAHIEDADLGDNQNYDSKICCVIELPMQCVLTSAEWEYPEVLEGRNVEAIVNGTGCDGLEISFEVRRKKTIGFDSCVDIAGCENPSTGVFAAGSNSVTGTWTAAPSHDNEYYFVATVVATDDTIPSSTPDLLVTELPPGYCLSKTICSQYENEGYCNPDPCEVAEASVPSDIDCDDPTITCYCEWNSTTSECKAGWGIEGGYCGNDVINSGETCDGDKVTGDWGPITGCDNFDVFTDGNLDCYAPGTSNQCQFDTSNCTGPPPGVCGDDVINPGETCDVDWGPITGCSDFDDFTGGILMCADCQFDTSQCTGGIEGAEVGICIYTQSIDGNCDTDEFLTILWTAQWTWNEDVCDATCQAENQELAAQCETIQETRVCPAQIPLPFFNIYSFVAALTIIALIYVILILRKEKRKR